MAERIKIGLLLPSKGEMKTQTMNCILATSAYMMEKKIAHKLFFSEGTLVTHVRNGLIEQVIDDKEITHAVFIDSDMIFNPEWLVEMAQSDYPVTTGVAKCRGNELTNIFKFVLSRNAYLRLEVKDLPKTWCEVDGVGMSFFMFRRDVLLKVLENKKLVTDYFTIKMQETYNPIIKRMLENISHDDGLFNSIGKKSEDIIFCEAIKDAGFKIWLNPKYKLGHIIEKTLTFD